MAGFKKFKVALRLMRPANIVTSIADVLAGITISGFFTDIAHPGLMPVLPVIWLCISTAGLYGGGIVFNDVFDVRLDAVERPERPIPSGIISVGDASLLGGGLLLLGIVAALMVNAVSGILALAIALAALIYDKWGKHFTFLGPVNMGLCRGLNLLLGISILSGSPTAWWFLAFVPVLYIASVTMISRGEVHGGGRPMLFSAVVFYLLVAGSIAWFAFTRQNLWPTLPFLILFVAMIFPPLFAAIREPVGKNIGKAVKAGVIALIIMDASWAMAFGSLVLGLVILALLPVSLRLSKLFPVT